MNFVGTFYYTVSTGGSIVIPVPFRQVLFNNYKSRKLCVVNATVDRCLHIFPSAVWRKFADKMFSKGNDNAVRFFMRKFIESSVECEMDGKGRIYIPSAHREDVGIIKDITILGQFEKIELWDRKKWDNFVRGISEDTILISYKLDKLFEYADLSSILKTPEKLFIASRYKWDNLILYLSKNPEYLYKLPPREFEELVAEFLIREGYEIQLTPLSRDGGCDIIAYNQSLMGRHLFLIECKRYSPDRLINVGMIRELYGVVEEKKANSGMLVTTSFFTKDALLFSESVKYRLSLKDYHSIIEWLRLFKERNLGIKKL